MKKNFAEFMVFITILNRNFSNSLTRNNHNGFNENRNIFLLKIQNLVVHSICLEPPSIARD